MSEQTIPDLLIQKRTISDQVYDHVKHLILSGVYEAGEKIPELKIADQFKVSRTPVREALRKLAEYGLITLRPRSYAFVATIDKKEARDISMVRLCLEKLAFRVFAEIATKENYQLIRDIVKKCKQANQSGDHAMAHEYDSQLHLTIAKMTGNGELYEMLHMLDAKLQLVRLKQHLPTENLSFYFDQHATLVDLLEKHDLVTLDSTLERHIVHDLDFA
jgi:GntR family transcriptional regulator, rspAB operon transcriptional repressor